MVEQRGLRVESRAISHVTAPDYLESREGFDAFRGAKHTPTYTTVSAPTALFRRRSFSGPPLPRAFCPNDTSVELRTARPRPSCNQSRRSRMDDPSPQPGAPEWSYSASALPARPPNVALQQMGRSETAGSLHSLALRCDSSGYERAR